MILIKKKLKVLTDLSTIIALAIVLTFGSYVPVGAQRNLTKREHVAEINGIRLHYYVRGNGPVCLVPSAGWGIPKQYIMPLPIFEKHFTVVYYDTRLSGGSTGPSDPLKYTADDFMQDMDSLRVYLGQRKVWLAGHSMGGFQVLNYAVQHNENLSGLIVMSSIIKFDSVRTQQYKKLLYQRSNYEYYIKHPDVYQKAIAIQLGRDTNHYSLHEQFNITGCLYCHDGRIGSKFFSDLKFRDSVDHFIGTSGFYTKNVFSSLSKITVPTLVICGDDDFICDHISQSDRIHDQILSSQLVILKNCGHMLWAEQPKAFNSAVDNWLIERHL